MKNYTIALVIGILGFCSCKNASTSDKQTDTIPVTEATKEAGRIIKEDKFAWKKPIYDSSKKYVYLTFDDGPQMPGTGNCLEICQSLGVKGTFFMVGVHASNDHLRDVVNTIKEGYPNVLLANHSNTHAGERYRYFYQHPDIAIEDFLINQKKLDIPYKIIRLPGNNAWVRQGEIKASNLVHPICKLLDTAGYNVIGWDIEWNFNHKTAYPVQTVETLLQQIKYALNHKATHTANHIVILTHDRMFNTPAAKESLIQLIQELKNDSSYVFETTDNYPLLKM